MFTEVLFGNTQTILARLSRSRLLKEAYLAGGTGLALQLGHRVSVDLDFFTPEDFNPAQRASELKSLTRLKVEEIKDGTVIGNIGRIRFSLFHYQYPVLFPFKHFAGVKVADFRDITPMKISAICGRGKKRDFIDLYFICQKIDLKQALTLYQRKYRGLSNNLVHIYKSLVYFQDAETEPMPRMFIRVNWTEVKHFLEDEVKKIWK